MREFVTKYINEGKDYDKLVSDLAAKAGDNDENVIGCYLENQQDVDFNYVWEGMQSVSFQDKIQFMEILNRIGWATKK